MLEGTCQLLFQQIFQTNVVSVDGEMLTL